MFSSFSNTVFRPVISQEREEREEVDGVGFPFVFEGVEVVGFSTVP